MDISTEKSFYFSAFAVQFCLHLSISEMWAHADGSDEGRWRWSPALSCQSCSAAYETKKEKKGLTSVCTIHFHEMISMLQLF